MPEAKLTYRGVVYPWECDSMGHLTVRNYMGMFDDAYWHLLHEIGFDMDFINEKKIGWADVHHDIDYLRELVQGDLLVIESKPVRLGNKSLVSQLEMKEINSGEICARLTVTSVQFDLAKRCAIPLLDVIRERVVEWLDSPG